MTKSEQARRRHRVRIGGIWTSVPPGRRSSSPSPPSEEKRGGKRRPLRWNAPFPVPLPTRSSRGEGENFWRLQQDERFRILDFIRSWSFGFPSAFGVGHWSFAFG